ncbi:MAG TPA: FUSC family protein [Solirubrobacteraceae bacterium]
MRLAPLAATARGWLPVRSTPAALRAVRATLVMAGMFAITDKLIGNLQMATFAAFGSFATLVLSAFGGTRRDKLVAHALLALAGSALLSIGTAVSSSTLLAATVTVPVTFIVFFAGVAGPNAASGATGALLAYVLPAASPGTVAMIPDRLAGWWLASVAGTAAVLVLSPRPGADGLRRAASNVAASLAEAIEAVTREPLGEERLAAGTAAKHELLNRFNSTPSSPLGLAAPAQALANVVELLEWSTSLLADAVREHGDLSQAASVDRELLQAAAAVLADTASLMAGGRSRPDLDRLARAREQSLAAVVRLRPERPGFHTDAQIAFHAQAIAVAVLAIGADALVAERLAPPDSPANHAPGSLAAGLEQRRASLAAAAVRHASVRSVWLINSLRGSLALGTAVAVADLSSVQHGFWVVLGTLSVLRTNSAATGSTALRALTGTGVGFVIGGALLLAIGSSDTALWAVLPVAVFVAAYAPGTAPFAVGQAAFTVTVAVLFNLLAPVGWRVGIVRIEDVAIGCAVSLVVGSLFWPRGVATVVGDDLAEAFRAGASFLTEAIAWTAGMGAAAPASGPTALAASLRLDDALRGYMAEQGSKRVAPAELWRLVGGSLRLRLTAQAVAELPRDPIELRSAREAIDRRTQTLVVWYDDLAALLDRPGGRPAGSLDPPSFGEQDTVDSASGSHYGVWLCEHLDHLAEHLAELVQPALRVAELRRAPWWR